MEEIKDLLEEFIDWAKVGGGWNIEGMNAPFMREFLNEVQKLVDLSK